MRARRYPFWHCRYCDKDVRLRKDGYSAKHSGVNRFGKRSSWCIGSRYPVTPAAHQEERRKLIELNGRS